MRDPSHPRGSRAWLIVIAMSLAAALAASDETDEWVRKGYPSAEAAWTPAMYEQYLVMMREAGKRGYPRVGAKVFQRLVAVDNLELIAGAFPGDPSAMTQAIQELNAVNGIMSLYLEKYLGKESYFDETVGANGYMLHLCADLVPMAEHLREQIVPDDSRYQVRMDGLAKMDQGLAQLAEGAAQTMSDRTPGKKAVILAFGLDVEATIAPLTRHMSDEDKQAYLQKMVEAEAAESDGDLAAMYQKIVVVLSPAK